MRRNPGQSDGLGGMGPKTCLLGLGLAAGLTGCVPPENDPPRVAASSDASGTADAPTSELGSEASPLDIAQEVVDIGPRDSDGGPDMPDAAIDGSRDSSAADADESPCNQPGDAADGGRPYFDLVVGGRWNVPDGRRMFVLTREYASMIPRGYGSAVIKDGAFLLRFPRAYLNFSYQPIFYFLDVDDDGRCDETIDRVGNDVTSACQLRNCEGVLHESPNRPVDPRGNNVCDVMNACR